jgi:colanic acid/amylovoran biosynthesis glycosyltransferase
MNIAIVVSVFPTVSETFIVNQIVSLINEGHSVHVFSNHKGSEQFLHNSIIDNKLLEKVTYKKAMPSNKTKRILFFFKWVFVNFFDLDWALLFKSLNFLKYGKCALKLKLFFESEWFLKRKKFDIVHVHFGTNAKHISFLKSLGFLNKSKLIVTFHGYDINPAYIENYKNEYSLLFREVDVITVNTLYTKQLLLSVKSDLQNICILPVGLDTDFFKRDGFYEDVGEFTILYVGRLIPLKGGSLVIDILDEIHQRGFSSVKLVMIGEGEIRSEIEDKICRYGLENFVSLKGTQTQEQIKEAMNLASVFILPGIQDPLTNRAETQGLVIQEAQAMELPVVVSDAGGMKFGLLPNESGFVIKEKDIVGFANVIVKLLKNKELCKKMGKNGRDFVLENYDSNILGKQLISIYSEVKINKE